MSNHAKKPRVVAAKRLFPMKTPLTLAERIAIQLDAQIKRDKHDCHYVELGNDSLSVGYVECTCGFVLQSPFGEPQGAKQVEEHRARFHVIHDPMGAKYRD
jgi:hypothetical protein